MELLQTLLTILTGIATAIPLALKLVEYVRKATREKNWNTLLDLVMSLMKQAEEIFDSGADRKTWVLAMVKSSAATLNYDVDLNAVGTMIDSLCSMTKKVNYSSNKSTV